MDIEIDETKKDIESSFGLTDERAKELTDIMMKTATNSQYKSAEIKEMLKSANNTNEALILMFSLGMTTAIILERY